MSRILPGFYSLDYLLSNPVDYTFNPITAALEPIYDSSCNAGFEHFCASLSGSNVVVDVGSGAGGLSAVTLEAGRPYAVNTQTLSSATINSQLSSALALAAYRDLNGFIMLPQYTNSPAPFTMGSSLTVTISGTCAPSSTNICVFPVNIMPPTGSQISWNFDIGSGLVSSVTLSTSGTHTYNFRPLPSTFYEYIPFAVMGNGAKHCGIPHNNQDTPLGSTYVQNDPDQNGALILTTNSNILNSAVQSVCATSEVLQIDGTRLVQRSALLSDT